MPPLAAILGELQRAAVGDHGLLQQLVLSVERAQREVIDGDFGLNGEFGGFQVIGRGRDSGASALNLPAHAAPEVGLPTGIERDAKRVESRAAATGTLRLVCSGALAVEAGRSRELGKPIRAGDIDQGTGLLEVRIRGGELLVVGGGEGFKAVQLGIAEEFPPGATRQVRGGLGRLPIPVG
jgi:hypothetical protein